MCHAGDDPGLGRLVNKEAVDRQTILHMMAALRLPAPQQPIH
jgi:hypothetical protein